MKQKPLRITGHQMYMLMGMRAAETGEPANVPNFRAKRWFNEKGREVWSFETDTGRKIKGDPWSVATGRSLLNKGLIEPSFTMKHPGDYPHHPANCDIQFYRLSKLGFEKSFY